MGMFDEIRCKYKLPIEAANDGRIFQTKDTEPQALLRYEIDEQGQLFKKFNGAMVKDSLTGEVVFYTFYNKKDPQRSAGWMEFSADFLDGKLQSLKVIEDKPPKAI
jgi:hypothetical protein